MNTYRIAGLKVNMEPVGKTALQAQKYMTEFCGSPDITVMPAQSKLERRLKQDESLTLDFLYYMVSGSIFYRKLLDFDGFMLHSSSVCVDGSAYLFSGQSGIGKSTHTGFWLELMGDRCTMLNDDKPAIRILSGKVYASGTPWSGKHDMSENVTVPVKGLCFISRGERNKIERLDAREASYRIIHQCMGNFSETQWDKLFGLIDVFVQTVPVYLLKCINDKSAAELSIKTLIGEER